MPVRGTSACAQFLRPIDIQRRLQAMRIRTGNKPGQRDETGSPEAEGTGSADAHVARKPTFGENVILTIKVLAGFGLLGLVLWGIEVWMAAS